MSSPAAERTWVPLSPRERRILGVLVEKQKTTPENYPMSIAALVAGSNQKSNRDPVTNYSAEDIEDTLQSLRLKGAVIRIEGLGRVEKWRHNLYDWLDLKNQAVAMAILAELLLRGAQTEGELRSRASRMDPIPDLYALHEMLEGLAARDLIVFLSPPGQKRGVVVTHGLYPPEELERVRQLHAHTGDVSSDEPRALRAAEIQREAAAPGWVAEVAALKAEIEALKANMESLSHEFHALKAELGL